MTTLTRHCPSCQCQWHDTAISDAKATGRTAKQLLAALPRDPPNVTANRCRELDNALAHTWSDPTDSPCPICEDCEWLINNGEYHPDRLATRIGIYYASLLRHLKRHDRNDLRIRLDAAQINAA